MKQPRYQTNPTVFVDISEELLEGMLICLDWDGLRSKCREQMLCGISCELARAAADDINGGSHLHGAQRRQVTGGALRKDRESRLLGLLSILSCRSHFPGSARSKKVVAHLFNSFIDNPQIS